MATTTTVSSELKSAKYLENNPIVKAFVEQVIEYRTKYYSTHFKILYNQNTDMVNITIEVGNKYIKLLAERSVWGFISRVDGKLHGIPTKVGDLFKPAGYNSPAKHARGNIIDGTACWNEYGPNYLR